MSYRFIYGAISQTEIMSRLIAYGGYYGNCKVPLNASGNSVFNNAYAPTELIKISNFKDSVQAMDDTSSFTSTFSTADASTTWYYYIDSDLNLSNITFSLEGNAQSYNIYIVCGGTITLSGQCYGNFIANAFVLNGDTTVNGSVSALTGGISPAQYTLTVRLGCPQYKFTYAAIANDSIENITVTGKYGSVQGGNDVAGDSTEDNVNAPDELAMITSFKDQAISFFGVTSNPTTNMAIRPLTNISIAKGTDHITVLPVSMNCFYTLQGGNTSMLTLVFHAEYDDDVFYIFNNNYTNGASSILFEYITFQLSGRANPSNIYIINSSMFQFDKTLGQLYGNFVGTYYDCGSSSIINCRGTMTSYIADNSFTNYNTIDNFTITFPTVFAQGGFMKGTKLLTSRGYVPIEDLNIGDTVMTTNFRNRNRRFMPILFVHYRHASKYVVFKKGALGNNKPIAPLYVSPTHRITSDTARTFVNKRTIFRGNAPTNFYQIELGTHRMIVAEGVKAESLKV